MKCTSGQVQDAVDHLAEFLGRAGPCCFLSLKPEEASLSYWPLASALPSGVSSLGCGRSFTRSTRLLGSGHLVAIPQLSSATLLLLRQDRIFHRQNQWGSDDALWCPESLDTAPNFRTVRPDLSVRHSGQSPWARNTFRGPQKCLNFLTSEGRE